MNEGVEWMEQMSTSWNAPMDHSIAALLASPLKSACRNIRIVFSKGILRLDFRFGLHGLNILST